MTAIDLYAKASPDFTEKLDHSVRLLNAAEFSYAPLAQASSLGVEDMVVTHLLHLTGIECSIFMLDTGMLPPETLQLLERLQRRYARVVEIYRPNEELVTNFVDKFGTQAMYQSVALRQHCCDIRKMEPLERALQGRKGWLTGLRREQSNARAGVLEVEKQPSRTKVNPLADWTWGDVWHFVALNKVPYNPLHDQFYPSIGCAPCTRAVTLGEDPRSGRWWWEREGAKECGLHVQDGHSVIPIKEVSS